ncbi:hypothetical protein OV450_6909 [Actinobacteria bacterium OV450]|nr:hypothetical protein OV450_6909 [Actinobacteria bacterium OV450]
MCLGKGHGLGKRRRAAWEPAPETKRSAAGLQKNVLDRRKWTTREELRIAIVTWIERTYHRRQRQAALGLLTPIEYETVMTTPALQAA